MEGADDYQARLSGKAPRAPNGCEHIARWALALCEKPPTRRSNAPFRSRRPDLRDERWSAKVGTTLAAKANAAMRTRDEGRVSSCQVGPIRTEARCTPHVAKRPGTGAEVSRVVNGRLTCRPRIRRWGPAHQRLRVSVSACMWCVLPVHGVVPPVACLGVCPGRVLVPVASHARTTGGPLTPSLVG